MPWDAVLLAVLLTVGAYPELALARDDRVKVNTAATRVPIARFARVDTHLYRGAQPSRKAFACLRDMGIDTVISLRRDGARERAVVETMGMRFVHIPVTFVPFGRGGDLPREAVVRFFAVLDDPASGNVFVHCQRGADRTGAFVGLYRIVRQEWTLDRAFKEAREMGMQFWYSHMKPRMDRLAQALPNAAPAVPQWNAEPEATS